VLWEWGMAWGWDSVLKYSVHVMNGMEIQSSRFYWVRLDSDSYYGLTLARVFTCIEKMRHLLTCSMLQFCCLCPVQSIPVCRKWYIHLLLFFHVQCQEHNGNSLIMKWQALTFHPWNVASITTVSWCVCVFFLYKNTEVVKTDLWFLNTVFQNNNTHMHVSSYADCCIMDKYPHIRLAVSWRYHNNHFMHYWLLLNRTQQSIRNFTGSFHNEHTSAMIWYHTETLSLLPKLNYIIIFFKNPVWLCLGLSQFLWRLI
jgi:hypothetical protein